LSTGPISLTFMTADDRAGARRRAGAASASHIDDTVLEWTAGSGGLPEFRVHGLHVLSPQGDLIAEGARRRRSGSSIAALAGRDGWRPARVDLIGPADHARALG